MKPPSIRLHGLPARRDPAWAAAWGAAEKAVESFLDEPGCDDAGKNVLYVIACRGRRVQVYIVRNKRDLTVNVAIQDEVICG
jgi:hypothetical protein